MPLDYASPEGVFRHLLEHYGMAESLCPIQREALRLCGPLTLSVDEALRGLDLPRRARALDLGCAVGGNTFRLRHYFDQVVGVDRSKPLLAAARELQQTRETSVIWTLEGFEPRTCSVRLPAEVKVEEVEFREADILQLPDDLGAFDLVYMEKVLECLSDPGRGIRQIPKLVAPGGCFVHISCYWWTKDCTPPEKQLGTPAQALAAVEEWLAPHFTRVRRFNVPFLIQYNTAWFHYGLAEAVIWKRL